MIKRLTIKQELTRRFVYPVQRLQRGFDDSATWDVGWYLFTVLPAILARYRVKITQFPCNPVRLNTPAEWYAEVDELILLLNKVKEMDEAGDEWHNSEVYKLTMRRLQEMLPDLWW